MPIDVSRRVKKYDTTSPYKLAGELGCALILRRPAAQGQRLLDAHPAPQDHLHQ